MANSMKQHFCNPTDPNPSYDTPSGNTTTDKVFLLSIAEINKYFDSTDTLQCQGTAYCFAQGTQRNSTDVTSSNCKWWLRSPGSYPFKAANIDYSGDVNEAGDYCNAAGLAVRPAMWISIES